MGDHPHPFDKLRGGVQPSPIEGEGVFGESPRIRVGVMHGCRGRGRFANRPYQMVVILMGRWVPAYGDLCITTETHADSGLGLL